MSAKPLDFIVCDHDGSVIAVIDDVESDDPSGRGSWGPALAWAAVAWEEHKRADT